MSRPLSYKQRMFVYYYVNETGGNGTEAARKAGYSCPEVSAYGLMKLSKIKGAINAASPEPCMTAEEVLARIEEHATIDVTQLQACIKDEVTETEEVKGGKTVIVRTHRQYLDLDEIRRRNLGRLIKKIHMDRRGRISIETHDAQAALFKIGAYYALWKERVQMDDVDISALSDEQLLALVKNQVAPKGLPGPRRQLPGPDKPG